MILNRYVHYGQYSQSPMVGMNMDVEVEAVEKG